MLMGDGHRSHHCHHIMERGGEACGLRRRRCVVSVRLSLLFSISRSALGSCILPNVTHQFFLFTLYIYLQEEHSRGIKVTGKPLGRREPRSASMQSLGLTLFESLQPELCMYLVHGLHLHSLCVLSTVSDY